MTSVTNQHLRDPLDAQLERATTKADVTRSRFDYARLLRGSTAPHRPVMRSAQTSERESAPAQSNLAEEDAEQRSPAHRAAYEPPATVDLDGTTNDALGARVADAVEPVVSTMLARQQRIVDLVGTLAREIAGFCSDPSIVSGGSWDAQMKLDERLFPQTTLYLRLSGLAVSLRFDAVDPESKQLLLDHSSMLERELDAALRAWGESRDIQLTVW